MKVTVLCSLKPKTCFIENYFNIFPGAICSCPAGFVGDPLTACRQTRERTGNVNVVGRFRRHEFDLPPYFFQFY
jgi:hypothetical protein